MLPARFDSLCFAGKQIEDNQCSGQVLLFCSIYLKCPDQTPAHSQRQGNKALMSHGGSLLADDIFITTNQPLENCILCVKYSGNFPLATGANIGTLRHRDPKQATRRLRGEKNEKLLYSRKYKHCEWKKWTSNPATGWKTKSSGVLLAYFFLFLLQFIIHASCDTHARTRNSATGCE